MKILPLSLLAVAVLSSQLAAADVSFYGVTKAQFLAQASAATPVVLPTGGFTFAALVDASTASSVTSATLRLPNLTTVPFGPVPGVAELAVTQQFDTLAAMDAAYASGGYRFTINGASDGTRTPTLTLPANAYPTTPEVTNFTAAQHIDWTQPLTVSWVAFAGGNSLDFIQLDIRRSDGSRLFSTPSFGASGALNGTATSTTIPANTFVPGRQYAATLTFGNVINVDLTSYGFFDGVPGVTAYVKTTQLPMASPGTTPLLTISKGAGPGTYDLTWNADVGRAYELQSSPDLVAWSHLALVTADDTSETVTDTPVAPGGAQFYKLVAVP